MDQAISNLNNERRTHSATVGTLKWRRHKMDVVVEGQPHYRKMPAPPVFHVYRHGETGYMTPAFDFELSIAHLLDGELLLLQQTDRPAGLNTLHTDWAGYEDLHDTLATFAASQQKGNTTGRQLIVDAWNRLSIDPAAPAEPAPLEQCFDLLEQMRGA